MREKPCRIISLFGIVQFLYERKGYEVPLLSRVYSGWSLWVSDNNNGGDRTQGRPPSFPLCDCIFTNLMVWIKYGQSSEIFLPRVYFIYIRAFPLTWPILSIYLANTNIFVFISAYSVHFIFQKHHICIAKASDRSVQKRIIIVLKPNERRKIENCHRIYVFILYCVQWNIMYARVSRNIIAIMSIDVND